ncbi:hypothetical protein H2200_013052 [Cladophialophora chaetospira]|uniref:Zn(2)-C6 fungal-type domain-containing protein n=1 Tax=Cladophialophora chaetospira TaxID=386627 RepID=A0AA39CBR3_9EURO|nr:hypothetical protein H2200_013052 [Cladophialophora chaetospira]
MSTTTAMNSAGKVKTMRKGTKSCNECRRRKIKCTFLPSTEKQHQSASTESDQPRTKCLQCKKRNRNCGVQGEVNEEPFTYQYKPPKPIYKRRRSSSPSSATVDQLPRRTQSSAKQTPNIGDEQDRELLSTPLSMFWPNAEISEPMVQKQVMEIPLITSFEEQLGVAEDLWLLDDSTPGTDTVQYFSTASSTDEVASSSTNEDLSHSSALQVPAILLDEDAKRLSPLLSQLFNNDIIRQLPITAIPVYAADALVARDSSAPSSITDAPSLKSTITGEDNILQVLKVSANWWISIADKVLALDAALSALEISPRTPSTANDFPAPAKNASDSRGFPPVTTVRLQDFVMQKLSQTQNPIALATGLLCLALSLYHLSGGDQAGLSSSKAYELTHRITSAVDATIFSPSKFPDYEREPGILLPMMLQAKLCADRCQLSKAWFMFRRTIELAKKRGFTDPGPSLDMEDESCLSRDECDKFARRQCLIGYILEINTFMSLMLGFPHVRDESFGDRLAFATLRGEVLGSDFEVATSPEPQVNIDVKMRALRRITAVAAGCVNDRNASADSEEVQLKTTMDIQATLTSAADQMPSTWWNLRKGLPLDAAIAEEHLATQMWFWQVQAMLHLPFMLKCDPSQGAASKSKYELNRQMCMEGCRKVMRIFVRLRSDPSLSVNLCTCVHCGNFQGIHSTCTLLVGHLIHSVSRPACSTSSAEKREMEQDLALIEQIKDLFRYEALQQGPRLNEQGLPVLDGLLSLFDQLRSGSLPQNHKTTLLLPYFGTIRLRMSPRNQPFQWLENHACGTPDLPVATQDLNGQHLPGKSTTIIDDVVQELLYWTACGT